MVFTGTYLVFSGSSPTARAFPSSTAISVSKTTGIYPLLCAFPSILLIIYVFPHIDGPASPVIRPFGMPLYKDPEIIEFSTIHPVSIHSSTELSDVSDKNVASGLSLSKALNASRAFLSIF